VALEGENHLQGVRIVIAVGVGKTAHLHGNLGVVTRQEETIRPRVITLAQKSASVVERKDGVSCVGTWGISPVSAPRTRM